MIFICILVSFPVVEMVNCRITASRRKHVRGHGERQDALRHNRLWPNRLEHERPASLTTPAVAESRDSRTVAKFLRCSALANQWYRRPDADLAPGIGYPHHQRLCQSGYASSLLVS